MERVKYRIESKLKKADGTPDFVKYGTTADITETIRYHQFYLSLRCHPDPQLMAYSERHGWNCFEYIVDADELAIIETAKMKVPKEKRKRTSKP